jgi:glyoxylase-like metal-dependent hydrolase (beta-lactamase superfamily II)
MTQNTIQLGPARVSLLNLGEVQADLADWLGLAPPDWPPEHKAILSQPFAVPVQALLIEQPGATALVDACDPLGLAEVEAVPPGYVPPPDLLAQLAALGVAPEQVGHVVVTHLHTDHYIGLAHTRGGELVPCLPAARHYIGRADWHAAQPRLVAPTSYPDRVLAALARHGLVEPVDGARELATGLEALATPGETPGHLALRLRAGGQTLYALGDLYHHAVEIERSDWLVRWADPITTRRSRELMLPTVLAEQAIVMAAHIPGFGRLQGAGAGVRWDAI